MNININLQTLVTKNETKITSNCPFLYSAFTACFRHVHPWYISPLSNFLIEKFFIEGKFLVIHDT